MLKHSGFTLVETLVYTAVIGTILTTFVSYTLTVSGNRNKGYALSTVQSEGRLAMELMARYVRTAEDVLNPAPGSSADQLILSMPAPNPGVTFSIVNSHLYMTVSGGVAQAITDSKIRVTALTFTNLALLGERDNIQMNLAIIFNTTAGDTSFGSSEQLHTTVSLRQ